MKPAEFRRVFSGSKRSPDGLFTVLARDNEVGMARLGLAIARKCVKRAVERNRIKRIIRESFRTHRQALAGFDLVVMCRPSAVLASNADLATSLLKHWNVINRKRQCASC